jgi:hypothetical protein
MARDILPVFSEVEKLEAAEALSEPFMRPDAYTLMPEADLSEAEPVAVGVAYISDEGVVEHAFVMANDTDTPLATVQQFAEGYDHRVGFYHGQLARMAGNASIIIDEMHQDIIEKTRAERLTTMSGFAIFASSADSSELSGGFFLPRKVYEELPLEARERFMEAEKVPGVIEGSSLMLILGDGRSLEEIGMAHKGIKQNDRNHQMYGVAMAALLLPSVKEARKLLAADHRVGDFLALPRKQRRKLIKEERQAK